MRNRGNRQEIEEVIEETVVPPCIFILSCATILEPPLVMNHKLTPPLCLSAGPCFSAPSCPHCFFFYLYFFLPLFASLSFTLCLFLRQTNPSSISLSRPWSGGGREGGREGGLQWMSIPVVSEVTATQRSHWQQHWTPQFAHAGMCDIVTVQSHRSRLCRIPQVRRTV